MLIDACQLPLGETLETEVCIIGAGPAGISLAREFVGLNIQVTLLESGGFEYEPETQLLASGSTIGDAIPPIDVNHRQFGGNSNVWAIKIRPNQFGLRHAVFDEIDFEKRDWVPHSGWPFSRHHLTPYYERAQVVCKAGPFAYNSEYWENHNERQRLPLDNTALETGMFQFGPSDTFHTEYREELKVAHNIKVIIHANVVEIVTNESGKTVNSLRIVDLAGKESKVLSKVFILACGGFANARLLLMSNQQQSMGLGNQNDVVGRYYHDHPQAMGGNFIPADRNLFNRTALYDLRQVEGNPVMGFLRLSKRCLEEEKLLNINTYFFPKPGQRQAQAIASFKSLAETMIRKPEGEDPLSLQSKDLTFKNQKIDKIPTHLLNIMFGLDYVAKAIYLAKTKKQSLVPNLGRGGWSELDDNRHRFRCFETLHLLEQSPDPNNRVILSRERDALGCQKIEVHYRWSQDDAERTARALSVISRELLKTGLGQFKVELDKAGLPKVGRPTGSAHLMGTTRMHDDPKQGVVDSDCRVHDISNLYIAGSSTFPTGGYANPTLTIVAMAIRLADLIKHKLNHSSGY